MQQFLENESEYLNLNKFQPYFFCALYTTHIEIIEQ